MLDPSVIALTALIIACALPWWFASRLGLAPGVLPTLYKVPLIGSILGMIVAMAIAISGPAPMPEMWFALPLGAIAGYPFVSVLLFVWVLRDRRRQVAHLRHLVHSGCCERGWSHDPDSEVDRRVEAAFERLDGYLSVKFIPCTGAADSPGAYEDWSEVIEEDPGHPAYLIVPALVPLRRYRRPGSDTTFTEPWNPYAAVLFTPARLRRGGASALLPASDGPFCCRVQWALTRETDAVTGAAQRPLGIHSETGA